jgi:hypothetical protein
MKEEINKAATKIWSQTGHVKFPDNSFLTPMNLSYIVIKKDTLSPGITYAMTLTVSYNQVSATGQVTFVANRPPVAPKNNAPIVCNPKEGTEATDLFTCVAYGWNDPDNDTPLLYTYAIVDGTTDRVVREASVSTIVKTYMPTVNNSSKVILKVIVQDQIGDSTSSTLDITVIQATADQKSTKVATVANKLDTIKDNEKRLESINLWGTIGITEPETLDKFITALETFITETTDVDETATDSLISGFCALAGTTAT